MGKENKLVMNTSTKKVTLLWLLIGIILSVVPSAVTLLKGDKPDWFNEAIFITTGYIVTSILIYMVVYLIITKIWNHPFVERFFLITALPFVLIPNLYLNAAYFLGAEQASFETWHLLTLFTMLYQFMVSIFVAFMTFVIFFILWLVRKKKNA